MVVSDSRCCYVVIIAKHYLFLFNSSNRILTVYINMHLNKFCEADTRSWMMIKSCQVECCFCILSSPQRYNTNPTNFLTLLPTILNGEKYLKVKETADTIFEEELSVSPFSRGQLSGRRDCHPEV